VARGTIVRKADVTLDETLLAVRARREMEALQRQRVAEAA